MSETAIVELLMSFVGFIMAVSCVPQIMRVIELESSKDVSLLTTQMLLFGEVCWVAYSFYIKSVAIFVYGFLSLILLSVQFGVIMKYRENHNVG